MVEIIFNMLLYIYIFLCGAFLVVGNIFRFVCWLKSHNSETNMETRYCTYFWNNEWGNECTMAEIENLKEIVRQFEKSNNITNENNSGKNVNISGMADRRHSQNR